MNETTPSQAAIARAIGVAKSRITALKAQGMPVHSIEAAQAWRRTHLNPARTKPPPRPPSHPAPSPAVLTAQTLMEAAGLVLAAGGSIEPLIPGLRRAMRAVPPHQRDDVELNPEVMRVLLAPLLALSVTAPRFTSLVGPAHIAGLQPGPCAGFFFALIVFCCML